MSEELFKQMAQSVIEGEDENYRSLTVGTMIRDALVAKLEDSRRPLWRSRQVHDGLIQLRSGAREKHQAASLEASS